MQIRTILGRLMRRTAAVVMSVGMAIGLGATSMAAGLPGHISVEIPFAFHAGRTTMPSGDYIVREVRDGVLSIEAASGEHTLVLSRGETTGESGDGTPSLVFACYGPERFLSEVRSGCDGTYFRVAKTKSEERLAKAAESPGTVLVIAAHGR